MFIKRFLIPIGFIFYTSTCLFAQENAIKIPTYDDKYSQYVKQLEAGKTDIDFADFRNSYLESRQYNEGHSKYNDLKKQVYAEIKSKNYNEIIRLTQSMLSIDYTSMFAHKYLQQSYKLLGDTLNCKKYHDIEFGLLKSITRSGDGKSCETGWHVIQIEEEYFILNMLNVDFKEQRLVHSKKNSCDKMVVEDEDGKSRNYFFEINKIWEMEMKMFGK